MHATSVIVWDLYETAFIHLDIGYASSMAFVFSCSYLDHTHSVDRSKKMGELLGRRGCMADAINVKKMVVTIIMFLGSILFLLPFIWMLSTSFKIEADVFEIPIEWIPKRWNGLNNYREVWFGDYPFYIYYWNSIK